MRHTRVQAKSSGNVDVANNNDIQVASTTKTTACDVSWSAHTIGGEVKCFKYFGRRQLQNAASFCASAGTKLLSPKNSVEFNDLRAVVEAMGKDSAALDGNDSVAEGVWMTSSGSKVPFLEWGKYPHQPSNDGDNEHCLHFGKFKIWQKRMMNDHKCSHIDNVICEKQSNGGKFCSGKRRISF